MNNNFVDLANFNVGVVTSLSTAVGFSVKTADEWALWTCFLPCTGKFDNAMLLRRCWIVAYLVIIFHFLPQ